MYYSSVVSYKVLDEPVDLYSEWIDACEAVNQPTPSATRAPKPSLRRPQADEEDDDDDVLPDIGRHRSSGEADADVRDSVDEDDAEVDGDASAEMEPAYERPRGNEKTEALIAHRKARAEAEEDDDDE